MSSSASHPSYTLGPCDHLSHSPPLPCSNAPGSPGHPEEKPESLQEPQDPNEVCTGPPLLWLLQHAGTPPPQGPCTSCPFSWECSLPRYPWGPTPLSPVSAHMSLSFRSLPTSLHKSAPCYFPKSSIFLHRCFTITDMIVHVYLSISFLLTSSHSYLSMGKRGSYLSWALLRILRALHGAGYTVGTYLINVCGMNVYRVKPVPRTGSK